MRRMPPRVYESDFDTNGMLYWLGTNGGTTAYVNPHTAGRVVVTPSSIFTGHTSEFIGHVPPLGHGGQCYTESLEGSSVAVQLPLAVIVTRYTFRHGNNNPACTLRNWNFEGSNDGVEWVVLRQHVNDRALPQLTHSTASWDVDSNGRAFSHYRIHQTGINSPGIHNLLMGGLELYGSLDGFAPGLVNVPRSLHGHAPPHVLGAAFLC